MNRLGDLKEKTMEKLIQILMKTIGLSKLVLMVWNALYKILKKKTDETQNEIDGEVLEIVNTIILAICGELNSKK